MIVNLERARARMEEAGLEALVCVQPINVYYASGYESDWLFDYQWAGCAILPLSEDRPATLIVHDVELTNLAEHPSWMPELRVYETQVGDDIFSHYTVDEEAELEEADRKTLALMEATRATASTGVVEAILKALSDGGYRRLGFDDARLASLCAERLANVQCFDRPELMTMIRAVKTPAELELMREAGRRNQQALRVAIDAAGVGVKWSDIRRAWHLSVAEQDCMPWCIYVGAGHKSMGLWHDHDYPIREGDQLCFDSMLTWQRYFGDMQRTCVMGAPSAKLKRYWNAAYAAAEAVFDAMRPGVNTVDLRKLALEVGKRGGIKGFRHAFMHGLGLEHLELPSASPGLSGFDLEEGMVVNMDMEVCEIGFGGIYYENTLLIGPNGPEYLCDMPRELIHLPC
ncbi:MAG: aminopeptidase P family protein [Gammaproteobacteria bacterium]|nr:aminopeptidase P family protein [Gammaproteobacteria bacterium]MYF68169.1 aminopeptidase P family protein [Gammaproteobacteria bacterium]MYK37437.1 aminopeptidase P family protein [Gammaproteobacteria bacterium]